jgi:hypothetical protein
MYSTISGARALSIQRPAGFKNSNGNVMRVETLSPES